MTCNLINRRTVGALTAAVVLGAAGPAAARFDTGGPGPVLPQEHVAHYGKANVLPPYMPAPHVTHYGKANVLAPYIPAHMRGFPETVAPVTTTTPRAVVNHRATGDGSDLVYVIVGGVVFAIGGLGGAFVAGRKRGAQGAAQPGPTIAA
jgi:hypothetical protein